MLQNIAHPHKNPTTGEYVSFRNTYTPPVRGKAEASSAHTNAPKKVNVPASNQIKATPPKDGTSLVISVGCTKIAAPIMVPTTMAVVCVRLIDRDSRAGAGWLMGDY